MLGIAHWMGWVGSTRREKVLDVGPIHASGAQC